MVTKSNIKPKQKKKWGIRKASKPNRLRELLLEKGMKEFKPTAEVLKTWGISNKRWNQILRNEADMEYGTVEQIAIYFRVKKEELFPKA